MVVKGAFRGIHIHHLTQVLIGNEVGKRILGEPLDGFVFEGTIVEGEVTEGAILRNTQHEELSVIRRLGVTNLLALVGLFGNFFAVHDFLALLLFVRVNKSVSFIKHDHEYIVRVDTSKAGYLSDWSVNGGGDTERLANLFTGFSIDLDQKTAVSREPETCRLIIELDARNDLVVVRFSVALTYEVHTTTVQRVLVLVHDHYKQLIALLALAVLINKDLFNSEDRFN